jgi:hypothetical protein
MSRNVYALLVGINDYLGGVNGLSGCVNDVKRMQEFLELRTKGGDFELKPLVLTSGDRDNPHEVKPTRQAVIDGFRDHLCQAKPEDVALFYYSGHGSQEKSPPELWHLEPDKLDETIVCYDSRTDDGWDLADKELGLLIAEVAKQKPHIVVILDACHSGSGTRGPQEEGVRLAPNDMRERPLDSFEGMEQLVEQKAIQPDERTEGDWLVLPEGKHVVLSACRPEEVANERFLGDGVHGVMSHFLLDTLQRADTHLSYRDLFSRVGTLVRNRVAQQNPVIEATELGQLQEPFLGGAIKPQPPYFSLTYSTNDGWVLGGGAVNGISPPVRGETTTLAVFDLTTDLASVSSMEDALGWAKVTEVRPGESLVDFTLKSEKKPSHKDAFRAVVVGQPLPPMWVWMEGDEAGLGKVRDALKGKPSLIVQELTPADLAAETERTGRETSPKILAPLMLIARDGRYLIRRSDDAYPLMVPVEDEDGYGKGTARLAIERLEHVARWMQVAQLDNKNSNLPKNAVTMELYAIQDDGSLGERLDTSGGTIRLEYQQEGDKWVRPRFKLRLVNNTDQRLYCALLDLTETFAIQTAGLLKGGGEWLEPKGEDGSEVWAYQGKPIPAGIPKRLLDQGVVALRDIAKLIVSTTQVPATLLERDELGVATKGLRSAETPAPKSSLARMYNRVQTRGFGDLAPPDETITDWVTAQITLTTVRPRDGVNVPSEGEHVSLSDIVSLDGHPALKARSRLTTFAEGTRDAGNLALPPVFRQHPELASPFQFSDYRDGAPGLSVLELQVQGDTYQEVTPESPLLLHVAKPVAGDEYVLPVAFDPETKLHLPLGVCERHKNTTTIRIDRLPKPMSETKDLLGSIKLFFQKVVAEKLGLGEGETARLAIATVLDGGQIEYDASPVELQARVAAADKILLYVHGFTGDTRGLVASSEGLPYEVAEPPPILAGNYDLILAFDYESINTPVEETAIKLKERLAAAGLDDKHEKTLDIVAHSLGTLVTRWFIERQGGHKVVHKAILVGPPNQGTPWAKIEDWAIVGLGAAINGLAAIIWPPAAIPAFVGVLGSLIGGVEKIDTTLDQIKPGSKFYKLLNSSEDPKVPYVVIAGNTSKIRPVGSLAAASERKMMEKLVERLASKPTRTRIADLVFFGSPNDTSISVESMVSLPTGREPKPDPQEIACDHVSYFSTEVGLRAIAAGLGLT